MITADKIRDGKRVTKRGHVEIYSEPLNLTFRCPVKDPRAKRLESIVIGFEQAAEQRTRQRRRKQPETLTI